MIRRPPRSTLFPYTTLFRSHPGGVHPLALRLACGIGLRVALFVTSPALGFAPAPLGLLGAALGLLESPHRFPRLFLGILGSFLGLLGPAFGFTVPFFRFRSPPLGYAGAPLGLLGLALGRAPGLFGLLDPRLGLLSQIGRAHV